ncbi:hypothetical protein ABPG75_003439 [Micractinium tetrahymenae]
MAASLAATRLQPVGGLPRFIGRQHAPRSRGLQSAVAMAQPEVPSLVQSAAGVTQATGAPPADSAATRTGGAKPAPFKQSLKSFQFVFGLGSALFYALSSALIHACGNTFAAKSSAYTAGATLFLVVTFWLAPKVLLKLMGM